ncbi:beta-lactamase regulating signal transducer with metallopeptidase domain [Leeuwenhoekiella aestuarii]|uniref:Beta-lactamase regulating signal transducer with metallopeptidase domain n=1 Tax=Leeuwenhoekiella aestuarii TaxID=2249426 RepID=A0A4Q0P125_9FLAO|nr:M56 family metallopeptidase [Leeuwenhoekiella aestuarii]RXG18518.1 beta-lactamase regulating signal transducer with metallopeptidase domain [Leeuwenhoekiella aestuarii]RXG19823.1 beta-lactamase regulating signal transducer with metallopeptidase domain [Leeuwenhoekiella aestuarii]
MTAYLIKSILCLLVLWGFYKIALEQTAAHHFKRFYLLGSMVIALTLPLLTFSYTVEVEPQTVIAESAVFEPTVLTETTVATPVEEPTNWLAISLGVLYAAGVLLFGFRFLRNLIRLRRKITNNEKVQAKGHINVLLLGKVIPHSFLRFIFMPKKEFKNNSIAPEVLAHEHAHVAQKHSWDILFIEFLQVVFWFNPLLSFVKKEIALNHEFLADQAALKNENSVENYTHLLFTYSGGAHHTALSSPINYSLTKKRILMLSKTRSVKKLATRLSLFVPVLALCIYFFNQEIVAKPVQKESTSLLGKWVDRKKEFAQFTIYKEGKQLWMKFAKDTFKLEQEGENQYEMVWKNKPLSTTNKKVSLRYNPNNNELFLNEKSFIRPENTYGKLFAGDWEGVDVEQQFFIRSNNGGIGWEIKDQFGTNTYFPVLYDDGFYFTLNNRDVYFKVNGDTMTSSEGHTYKKIKEAPKLIWIIVTKNYIGINAYSISSEKFVAHINEITANWSAENYKNYILDVGTQEGMEAFVKELNTEFKKTQLYRINSSQDLLTQGDAEESSKPVPAENKKIGLSLKILKDGSLLLNGYTLTDLANLESALDAFYKPYSSQERRKKISARIDPYVLTKSKTVEAVQQKLQQYGIAQIKVSPAEIPKPAISNQQQSADKSTDEETQQNRVVEDIHIEIDKTHQVYINNKRADPHHLEQELMEYNSWTTKSEREAMLPVKITVDPVIEMAILTDVKSALREYGVKSLKVVIAGDSQEEALIPAHTPDQNSSVLTPQQKKRNAGTFKIGAYKYYYNKNKQNQFVYYDRFGNELSEKDILELKKKSEKEN